MLVTHQEFGAYQIAALLLIPYAWMRSPALRPLVVWWVVGFFWHFYGTTAPTRFVPLQRDPRYVAFIDDARGHLAGQQAVRTPLAPPVGFRGAVYR